MSAKLNVGTHACGVMKSFLESPACGRKGQPGLVAGTTTSASGLSVESSFSGSTVFVTGEAPGRCKIEALSGTVLAAWLGLLLASSSAQVRLVELHKRTVMWLAGSTGFVGSVVLEQLMRLCPTFKRIYLLIRVKRGHQGERQGQTSSTRGYKACMSPKTLG